MPKRGAIALGLTALGLALLLNFQVPADTVIVGRQPGVGGSTGGSAGGPSGSTSGVGANGGPSSGSGQSGGGSTTATGQRTVDGPVVDTRWGPVQVAVTVDGSRIVDVTALQLPFGGRSGQISSYVEPILRSQVLQAQSANIDGVSGATYTSDGYARSLQAALDSAGI